MPASLGAKIEKLTGSMFARRTWTLHLKDGEPACIPVPDGYNFVITGAQATDSSADKIVLEGIIQTIRIDRLSETDEVAQTDITDTTFAVIFPKVNPNVELNLPFSSLNTASVRATGGDLVLVGMYDAASGIEALGDL